MRPKNENRFRNLSRKELQNLCSKYGLSAIGPTPQLASSLFSLFKGKNVCPLPARYRSDDHRELHANSTQSKLPSDRQPNDQSATNEADGTSVEVPKDKGPIVSVEKMTDMRHSQTLFPPHECLVPHPPDMVTGMLDIGGHKDFSTCSISDTRNLQGQPSSLNHPCVTGSMKNDPLTSGSNESGFIPCTTTSDARPSNESHRDSKQTTNQVPSLQFFVQSENGIDIYVDLSSNPSNWIKSLEDGVNIYQNMPHKVCRGDYDEPMAHMETGLASHNHEMNKDNESVPGLLVAQTNSSFESPPPSTNLNGKISAEMALNRQKEQDFWSPVCDKFTQKKAASVIGQELQVLGSSIDTGRLSSDKTSSVANLKCLRVAKSGLQFLKDTVHLQYL